LGAGLYEARIVVPLWSRGVPSTLAAGDPFGRVAIDAGLRFWKYTTSAVALLAILALIFGFRVPAPQRAWRMFAALAEIAIVAWTLLYFRPTLVRLFMGHGAGLSAGAIAAIVHRWVAWSYVRIAVSLVAWCAALRALTLS
ncbi:MAG TPA: DUF1772 domain-containing protein, partial [Thermoanaerobaculia bacterium]|nr:DUF1772 domain-containing protein [Thermoanaerobaculia bacterium]